MYSWRSPRGSLNHIIHPQRGWEWRQGRTGQDGGNERLRPVRRYKCGRNGGSTVDFILSLREHQHWNLCLDLDLLTQNPLPKCGGLETVYLLYSQCYLRNTTPRAGAVVVYLSVSYLVCNLLDWRHNVLSILSVIKIKHIKHTHTYTHSPRPKIPLGEHTVTR